MRAFAITVAVLLAVALAINAAGEWDRRTHDQRVRAAAVALDTRHAVLAQRYLSERRLQTARLAVITRPRVLAFGSSRVQPLSTAVAGLAPGEFYNAGMAGATVDDYIAAWSTLIDAGHSPSVAILSIDVWVFNRALPQEEWRELAPEVERFLALAGAGRGGLRRRWDATAYEWHRAKEFFSWPVLRASVTALAGARHEEPAAGTDVERALSAAIVPMSDVGNRRAFRADGSVMNDLPTLPPARLTAAAIDYVTSLRARLGAFDWDAERARRLAILMDDMRARGVHVIAFMPPYHPVTWDRLRADRRYAAPLSQVSRFLDDLARSKSARFLDLSDPATVPCAPHEFFDGDHPTEPCLARIVTRLALPR